MDDEIDLTGRPNLQLKWDDEFVDSDEDDLEAINGRWGKYKPFKRTPVDQFDRTVLQLMLSGF